MNLRGAGGYFNPLRGLAEAAISEPRSSGLLLGDGRTEFDRIFGIRAGNRDHALPSHDLQRMHDEFFSVIRQLADQ